MTGAADRSAAWRGLAIAVGVVVLVAALLVVAAAVAPADNEAGFRLEVAKALVQLAVIAGLGGVVTAVIRRVESLRDEHRRRAEYWAGLFHDVVVTYNDIKTVRRTLRAFGFRRPVAGPLTAEQVAQFRAQMSALLRSQLALETVRRELQARHKGEAADDVRTVDRYIREIVREWEEHNLELAEGATVGMATRFPCLVAFLGHGEEGFGECSRAMEALEDFVRAERRGERI